MIKSHIIAFVYRCLTLYIYLWIFVKKLYHSKSGYLIYNLFSFCTHHRSSQSTLISFILQFPPWQSPGPWCHSISLHNWAVFLMVGEWSCCPSTLECSCTWCRESHRQSPGWGQMQDLKLQKLCFWQARQGFLLNNQLTQSFMDCSVLHYSNAYHHKIWCLNIFDNYKMHIDKYTYIHKYT